jgi:hypothetical protein
MSGSKIHRTSKFTLIWVFMKQKNGQRTIKLLNACGRSKTDPPLPGETGQALSVVRALWSTVKVNGKFITVFICSLNKLCWCGLADLTPQLKLLEIRWCPSCLEWRAIRPATAPNILAWFQKAGTGLFTIMSHFHLDQSGGAPPLVAQQDCDWCKHSSSFT